jgi:hypothetical protein
MVQTIIKLNIVKCINMFPHIIIFRMASLEMVILMVAAVLATFVSCDAASTMQCIKDSHNVSLSLSLLLLERE